MKPVRLRYTRELLQAYGAFDAANISLVSPRTASEEELATYHTREYLRAVQRFGRGETDIDAA